VTPRFTEAGLFSEGLAPVRVGGKTGFMIHGPVGGTRLFIGKDGKTRIRLPHEAQARAFAEGRSAVEAADGKCGYLDTAGKTVIPFRFSMCNAFSEGLAAVFDKGKWRYIDRNGNVVLQVPYDGVRDFSHGLAWVEQGTGGPNQRIGYIDKRGTEVWKPRPAM
jgi:hypothetical protein